MNHKKQLDVRNLEPCEPQAIILDTAERLLSSQYLYVQHRMKPGVLGEILQARGFYCHAYFCDNDLPVEMFIWRTGDSKAFESLQQDFGDKVPTGCGKEPFLPVNSFPADYPPTKNIHNIADSDKHPPAINQLTPEALQAWQKQSAQALSLPVAFNDTLRNGIPAPMMVVIPSGRFIMGDQNNSGDRGEYPAHEITITKPFALAQNPVTITDFTHFVSATAYQTPAERNGKAPVWQNNRWEQRSGINWRNYYHHSDASNNRPVVFINWFDAIAYCHWLSEQTDSLYTLPDEEEWEYGCRAGGNGDWCFGNNEQQIENYGWYRDNTSNGPMPVCQKMPNYFGLYDMHGNVAEWTRSPWRYYDENQSYEITRMVRGGSWKNSPYALRSAHRCIRNPTNYNMTIGFRIIKQLG